MFATKEFVTITGMDTLSERLNYALEATGISQSKLARRIGVKPQAIQAICSGRVRKSGYTAQMANVLGVSPEWLANGIGPMRRTDEVQEPVARDEVYDLAKKLIEVAGLFSNASPETVGQFLESLGYKPERRSGEERRQRTKPVPQNRRTGPGDRREGHRLERIIRPSKKRKDEEDEEPKK